jgi:shikimate dehydrogenase
MKKKYLLIGDPVEHSLSPQMQNAAMRACGYEGEFIKMRVGKENLGNAIQGIRALGFLGANVTIPHKEAVMEYLDEVEPLAKQIGAVNTIVNHDGHLKGYNTDGNGILRSLNAETNLKDKTVAIIGAGGCARAGAHTIANEGLVSKIFIINRSKGKAKALSEEINKAGVECEHLGLDDLQKAIDESDIIINCTSQGMSPLEDANPLGERILRPDLVVMDAVYNPLRTKFINHSTEAGCRVITGENMLVHQGAEAFRLWTGIEADIGLMHAVVRKHLDCPLGGMNVVLLGFMGSGKSSTGRALSRIMDLDFVDIDDEIEKMAGLSILEIFNKYGERRFRSLEMEAIKLHSMRRGAVIACGGGAVLNTLNLMRLRESSELFLLSASADTMVKRLSMRDDRPLVQGDDAERKKRIELLMKQRKPFYDAAGAVEIETDGLNPEEVANKIAKIAGEFHE